MFARITQWPSHIEWRLFEHDETDAVELASGSDPVGVGEIVQHLVDQHGDLQVTIRVENEED